MYNTKYDHYATFNIYKCFFRKLKYDTNVMKQQIMINIERVLRGMKIQMATAVL